MIPSMKRFYKYLLIYGLALAFIVSALTVPILTTSTDFSIYNTDWNGCSSLTERTYKTWELLPSISIKNTESDILVVHNSFINYDLESSSSSILIIGPSLTFSDEEANYIQDFLLNGGKMLLADDFGTGNDLLKKINATSRFSTSLLIDLAYEKKPQYGVVFDFQEHPITANVSRIMLNYATTLNVGRNATVLANSSDGSWLDSNMNGRLDEWERKGPLPVLAVERYGDGELILLSDPSVLINLMYKYLNNSVFNENLLGYLGSDRDVIMIDESHRDELTIFFFVVATTSILQKIGILFLLVLTLIIVGTKFPVRIIIKTRNRITGFLERLKKKKSIYSEDETIDMVMGRHPTWDRKILTRIVMEISREGGCST
ncbi:MAG: DUF4350 domain-containing protein [Candidatus Hodarchaeota archaeon]